MEEGESKRERTRVQFELRNEYSNSLKRMKKKLFNSNNRSNGQINIK